MMIKKLYIAALVIFVFCTGLTKLSAQEETFYTQYYLHPIYINPAYAGFENQNNLLLNFRNRWSAFPNSPRAYTINYDGTASENFGIGAQLWSEKIGDIDAFKFGAKFAYKLRSDIAVVSLGLSADYQTYSLKTEVFDSELYDPDDLVAMRAAEGLSFLDVGVGVFGVVDQRFKFGVTLPNLMFVRTASVDPTLVDDDTEKFLESYFIFLAYEIDVPGQTFSFEPSVLFKKERLVPFHTDFNLRLNFLDKKLIGGLSYEVGAGDRLGLLIGTRFSQFLISYSFDLSFKEFQDYSSGSHELTMGVRFGARKDTETGDMTK